MVASTGSNIVAVEYYFFDGAVATTPRTYTGFTAGQNVTIDYNAILVGLLPSTSYEIHIKGINAAGQRSAEVVRTFTTPSVICDIIPPNTTNTSRCDNGTVTLAASGVGAAPATYNWFDVATGGSLLASGSIYTPTVTATQTFFVNIIDGLGVCESIRVPVVASVVTTPTAPGTSGAMTCAPASLTLTATGGTSGEYRWYTTSTGGNPLNGETGGTYLTPVISASTIFYVAINNGLCESLRVPVIAEFCNRSPVISPATTSTVIGGIATLDLLTLISDADNNVDLSSLSIVSTPLSGALASIDANQNLTVNYQGNSFTGSEVLTLEVCDLKLACAQEQITIEVAGEIAIYNAVSPNGDGKNDEFYIQYIDLLPDTKDNKVTIFNRWGEVVFEVTNYNNSTVVFRGLNQSGKELPTGTYFYKLTFPGGATTRTGFISLRR